MIYVDNRQEVIVITDKEVDVLKNTILFALKEEEVNIPCEVSLTFVDNASIREINRENRQIDRETDVLSFPMLEYENNMVFKEYYKDFKGESYENNRHNRTGRIQYRHRKKSFKNRNRAD